jgi:hypothetical protein
VARSQSAALPDFIPPQLAPLTDKARPAVTGSTRSSGTATAAINRCTGDEVQSTALLATTGGERFPLKVVSPLALGGRTAWQGRQSMRQKALTYKTGDGGKKHSYLGRMEFASRLITNRSNAYLHRGIWKIVQIDRIEPSTWSPSSEVMPTVFVSPPPLMTTRS